jgi:hypothetical protein
MRLPHLQQMTKMEIGHPIRYRTRLHHRMGHDHDCVLITQSHLGTPMPSGGGHIIKAT